jgi:hypothetical protein
VEVSGIFTTLHEFYFTTAKRKILENVRCIVIHLNKNHEKLPIQFSTGPSNPRFTFKLDRLIVLSKSSLLGWFLHVSLIVTIKGRSPIEVSLIVIIKKV